jgi:hypothetical protein
MPLLANCPIEDVARLATVSPVEVVRYSPLLAHWEIDEVVKLTTERPLEVVRYMPLLANCPIEDVARLATVRPVEVVRKGVEVATIFPFPSTARKELARPVRMVEEPKVVVAAWVMAAVQVPEEAKVMKPELLVNWETLGLARLETVRPLEVVRYMTLLANCPIDDVARLATVRPVEVVR